MYEPLRVFMIAALFCGVIAGAIWIRFIVAYAQGEGAGHVQSLILGAVLMMAALLLGAIGVIGDLLAAQRTMTQRLLETTRRVELKLGVAPSHYEPGQEGSTHHKTTGADSGEATGKTEEIEALKL
jgi:hypothetical protein